MLRQVLLNAIVAGSIYALFAFSLGLISHVTKFFHFAHGGVYTTAAYLAYVLLTMLRVPAWIGAPAAVLFTVIIALLINSTVYNYLRRQNASSLVLMIASLGVLIVIQGFVSLVFGNDTKVLRSGAVSEGLSILGAKVTPIQLSMIATSLTLSLLLWLWIRYSTLGKMIRAIANDVELCQVYGISCDRVVSLSMAVASAIASISAILVGCDTDLTPMMGLRAILMGLTATVIGGVGSVSGSLFGGVLVGLAQHVGAWNLPTQWQDTVVFLFLIAFLYFKPQGLLGTHFGRARI